jgi:hypothetical protein
MALPFSASNEQDLIARTIDIADASDADGTASMCWPTDPDAFSRYFSLASSVQWIRANGLHRVRTDLHHQQATTTASQVSTMADTIQRYRFRCSFPTI